MEEGNAADKSVTKNYWIPQNSVYSFDELQLAW